LGNNAHNINLPKELDVSHVFNIVDLFDYTVEENMDQTDKVATGQQPRWVKDLPEKAIQDN
jgi:hypothetical protein